MGSLKVKHSVPVFNVFEVLKCPSVQLAVLENRGGNGGRGVDIADAGRLSSCRFLERKSTTSGLIPVANRRILIVVVLGEVWVLLRSKVVRGSAGSLSSCGRVQLTTPIGAAWPLTAPAAAREDGAFSLMAIAGGQLGATR